MISVSLVELHKADQGSNFLGGRFSCRGNERVPIQLVFSEPSNAEKLQKKAKYQTRNFIRPQLEKKDKCANFVQMTWIYQVLQLE